MFPSTAPQATAHACLRAALRAGAADARAHGLAALILALLLRLLGREQTGIIFPDAGEEEHTPYPHAFVMPPMGRAPHAACIEAGLVPDWILPGIRNRGMRPAAISLRPRRQPQPARAPPPATPAKR